MRALFTLLVPVQKMSTNRENIQLIPLAEWFPQVSNQRWLHRKRISGMMLAQGYFGVSNRNANCKRFSYKVQAQLCTATICFIDDKL